MFDIMDGFQNIVNNKGSGTMSMRKLARCRNDIEYLNTLARTIRDALGRYHFEGLPETMSERVILQSLCWYGCVFFFEKDGAWFALPGGATEDFNIYGDPKWGWVWGRNGFNQKIRLFMPGADDSSFLEQGFGLDVSSEQPRGVFIRENALCFPFVRYAIEYALAISDSMRTLDVCRENIKQPYIVVAEEMILKSVQEFFRQRSENVSTIVSSGVFPADKIKLLPFETNAQNLKNSTDMIEWYWNQWNLLCGQGGNANPDKKERTTVAEVTAGDDSSESYTDTCIQYIQQGLDIFNKVSGCSVKCVSNFQGGEKDDDIFQLSEHGGGKNPVPKSDD